MSNAAAPGAVEGISSEAAPSAEYVAQMTAAVHGDPTPAGAQPLSANVRPDHVPEKFWDPVKGEARWDDLAKSYAELETKFSAGAKPEEKPAAAATEPAPTTNKIDRPGDKPGEPSAFEAAFTSVEAVYSEKGEIGDAEIEALTKLGIPKQTIDNYFAGLAALAAQSQASVYEAAGGEETFKTAVAWAAENLSDADLQYYNANCDNPATQRQTVEWLTAKYAAARPSEGNLVQGGNADSSGDVFTSSAQMTAAIQDPRYKADPAFREQTAQKVLRSQRAGTLDTGAQFFSRKK